MDTDELRALISRAIESQDVCDVLDASHAMQRAFGSGGGATTASPVPPELRDTLVRLVDN